MKCFIFQIYCLLFHLAVCYFASGTAGVTLLTASTVFIASILTCLVTTYFDRRASQFSGLVVLACAVSFAFVNFFRLGVFTTQLYVPPLLMIVQTVGLKASMGAVNEELFSRGIDAGKLRYGVPHLFVATSTFALALTILQFSPWMNGPSFAWPAFAIFVINLVLIMTRLTSLWIMERSEINAGSPTAT